GDIVAAGVSGGNYGYTLMWIMVLALSVRIFFVSMIAKYQLYNQHDEGVLDGLARLHRWYPPFLVLVVVVMGHVFGAYLSAGMGEAWVKLTGWGQTWQWASLWNAIILALIFRAVYGRVERVFKAFLVLLSVSLIGTAIWVGPSLAGILKGTFAFEWPAREGPFGSLLIAMGMLGTVTGSIMNLVYPYFLEEKGWRGKSYRRLQLYDLMLAAVVLIVLNLSVWTLGAELIYSQGQTVQDLDGLTDLLGGVLGEGGRVLFLLGIFAAVFTSILGVALGLATLGCHCYLRWRTGRSPAPSDYQSGRCYQVILIWILVSPLVWTFPGMPGFITLTLIASCLQVLLVPFLAGGIWWITAGTRYIGAAHRNGWGANLFMALLLAVSLWGTMRSVRAVAEEVQKLVTR
ncbi:MAG: NRAMP family divalent metal transporter, partial [Acidobacteriota bacterium]